MAIRTLFMAAAIAAGGALLAAGPATAQTGDRSADRGQFGWYEDRDWTTRAPFMRGYEQGRMDERRRRLEGLGHRQFGWYEDRDWTTRAPFRRGREQDRNVGGRDGGGGPDLGYYPGDLGYFDRGDGPGFRHPRLWDGRNLR
ncbi:hypothetical protein [Falsiroseomonas sp.]|uniref:hypothetical protein n=1 Tax=Falsiroseomonas sp. TaxID=2870721 RepID=UPI003565536B